MRTKLTAILAFLAALTISAGGTASATSLDPDFDCWNEVGVQVCDNTLDTPVDVRVVTSSNLVLTAAELNILELELDNLFIEATADPSKNDIRVLVLDVYVGDFDLTILSGNVIVIGNLA